MSGPVEAAREAWGEDIPDWVLVLAQACEASTMTQAAKRLGRSTSLVSTVLRARYPGNLGSVEELVRGVFLSATVPCPAMGDLPTQDCDRWRTRARTAPGHNTLAVTMYRACHRCPRFLRPAKAGEAPGGAPDA